MANSYPSLALVASRAAYGFDAAHGASWYIPTVPYGKTLRLGDRVGRLKITNSVDAESDWNADDADAVAAAAWEAGRKMAEYARPREINAFVVPADVYEAGASVQFVRCVTLGLAMRVVLYEGRLYYRMLGGHL